MLNRETKVQGLWSQCGIQTESRQAGSNPKVRVADHPPGNHCQEARVSIFSTI